MGSLTAGAAKVNISPPVGTLMAGFAARDHGCVGVRDELWTRALYLSDGDREALIVGNDLLTFSNETADWIRCRIEERTGIPSDSILLNCTHTHSGPGYRGTEDGVTGRYLVSLRDTVVGAAEWAKAEGAPARIGWHREPVRCGVNRRELKEGRIILGYNPEGPVVPFVDILRISVGEDSPLAVLFSHPVHCVVMGSNNYRISGDLAGAAERFVERNTGAMAAFLQGCCGNINSHPSCSTTNNGATFRDVERLGNRLGSAVVKGLTEIGDERGEVAIEAAKRSFHLPVEDPPDEDRAREELREAERKLEEVRSNDGGENERTRAGAARRRAKQRLQVAREGLGVPGLPISVWALTLGEWAVLGIPAEVFVELGERVREGSGFDRTLVLGYTNGSWMYIPTAEAFTERGYEYETRGRYRGLAITEGAGEVLVEESLKLLETMGV